MKTYPACYPCLLNQAADALSRSGHPDQEQIQALKQVLSILANSDDSLTPSAIAGRTNQALRETLGVEDFYREEKDANHRLAFSYLGALRDLLGEEQDQLEGGLKVSAAGNVIDIVHGNDYDLWQEVLKTVGQELVGGGVSSFRERIKAVPRLLYLADNVGETVFDRVFIESLEVPVIYAVKSGPVLNDATKVDALAAGLDQVAQIVETGSQSPGTVLDECSPEFLEIFQGADLVLSKGQANYETLEDQGDKVFFLLRVKCPVISDRIQAPLGTLVFRQGTTRQIA